MRSSVDPACLPRASYTPDLPGQLDTLEDHLTEAFALALEDGRGDLPPAFERIVIDAFRSSITSSEQGTVGRILRELVTRELVTARAETLLHTIALVLDSDNAALSADCLAFAAGLHSLQGGLSETELAARHGVSRQAFSRRVTSYQEQLGTRCSRGMKDLEAQESYRVRAHETHGTTPAPTAAGKRHRTLISSIDRVIQALAHFDPDSLGRETRTLLQPSLDRLSTLLGRITGSPGQSSPDPDPAPAPDGLIASLGTNPGIPALVRSLIAITHRKSVLHEELGRLRSQLEAADSSIQLIAQQLMARATGKIESA